MKNFSEATVIKSDLKLKVVLELKAVDTCPCQIKINDELIYFGDLIGTNIFISHIGLCSPINVQMMIDRHHPQAIEITSLKIDDNQILPLYQHLATPPTNYLDFTGSWIFNVPNFYPWFHEITGQGWII
jgi:hypothetical protein